MAINNKSTWIGVLSLIAIEQIIKIVINMNFFDKKFSILPPILYFEPMFNRRYSWFNSMMKLDGSKWVHVVAVAIMSIFIFLFYMFLTNKFGSIKIVNIMFAFIFSGAMCSLIDKVFWDGSLDYILLNGFFTFDLKDLYIDIFIGLFVLLLIFKNKELREIDEKSMFKDFCNYILRKSNK